MVLVRTLDVNGDYSSTGNQPRQESTVDLTALGWVPQRANSSLLQILLEAWFDSTELTARKWDSARTGSGVLLLLKVLQLEKGGSGSLGEFDNRDPRRTVTTRQRRVIDFEDGIRTISGIRGWSR